MRSHRTIIADAGGPTAFGSKIAVTGNTVKQWARGDSIPARYWRDVTAQGLATSDELIEAAAQKRAVAGGEAA